MQDLQGKSQEEYLKTKPLRQLYPDIQIRKKIVSQKLQDKEANQVFIRCQPHPKYCTIPNLHCLNIIAPNNYDIAYLTATIHSRIQSKMLNSNMQSLYIFCRGKIVTAFRQKIGTFWDKFKDEDGVLYLEFADSAPF